jgi:hypothetical protein
LLDQDLPVRVDSDQVLNTNKILKEAVYYVGKVQEHFKEVSHETYDDGMWSFFSHEITMVAYIITTLYTLNVENIQDKTNIDGLIVSGVGSFIGFLDRMKKSALAKGSFDDDDANFVIHSIGVLQLSSEQIFNMERVFTELNNYKNLRNGKFSINITGLLDY